MVKLLDDFHFNVFREHVKNLSVRSYYPLALIDVIERSFEVEQESEKLYKAVYGDAPEGEKDMKKFFQLAHYTFKLTGFLARNYSDYLQHNSTRIQILVNTGKLEAATLLAEMALDVSNKIEDFGTEAKMLQFLAQREGYLDNHKKALGYFERIGELTTFKQALNNINHFIFQQLKDKGKDDESKLPEQLAFLESYRENKSMVVQLMGRLNICYLLHMKRDARFYSDENYQELLAIEEALDKYDYIIFPYLHNLRPKLSFLRLNYTARQLSTEKLLEEAADIIDHSEEDLFWNSFINQPEINSIAIQTSYLATNFFTSYRDDHIQLLPEETRTRIKFLKNRSKILLENKLLQENYVVRYINLSTIFAGLLLLGDKKEIEESYQLLDNLLLFYQQVAFHAYIDPIYLNMIMAAFCLKDFEKVEKSYRRYKKSTTGKVVNEENDLTLNAFYYASKWLETKREQYVRKFEATLFQTTDKPHLDSTNKLLREISTYFEFPISLPNL
ncbi:MAG: hypothetical protein GC192_16030 [Bacteroidetes bacterium]|nr:hypothetical protein [Bacteroidota bacterium]